MSFFPQVLARLMPARARVPEIQKGSATGALVAFEQLGQPVWSPRDYAAFAREGFMQNAICYRSVRMIAEAAASIPLLLYESDNEIGDHPLIDLLRRPSLDHTGTDFLEAWYGFLLVAGNAYVEAVPLDGQLRELHVLRPDRMKVIPGPDGWPEGYDYTAGGQSIRFIDDVVPGVRPILHMRMFNPLNDHYGMSPIEAASVAIDIHNTASAWNKALLDNSARPSGALVYGAGNGQMTAEQFARLKSELETSFEGARNAGRPLLLEGGLDWKPLSMSPKDMDFIEAKNSAAREIALALGVPPMLLGIPGDNTYSNYREASRALWRQTVLPLVNRTAKAFSAWLEPAYGSLIELRPDLDAIEALSSEREALWSRLEAASFLTDDEKRAVIGYAPKGAAKGGAGPFDGAGGRARKFNHNHDAQGRFTTGDSGASGGNDAPIGGDGVDPIFSQRDYSPDKPNWHHYQSGPNNVCSAELQCSHQEMADQLSRFAVPGRDPAKPVEHGQTYDVYDPRLSVYAGQVRTYISPDGLEITNFTLPGHVLHDGKIVRQAVRADDGSWSITTTGTGNNIYPGLNKINEWQGPKIFDFLDQRLRENIERHHGVTKAVERLEVEQGSYESWNPRGGVSNLEFDHEK